MDDNLIREIVAAAASKVMLDADKRYAAWLAAHPRKTLSARDLPGAGIDLSADLFALFTSLVQVVWNLRQELATGFVSGALANFATDWLKARAPALTERDIEAVATVVEEKVEAAFRARMPPSPGAGPGPSDA
jgi:hypothetical protein